MMCRSPSLWTGATTKPLNVPMKKHSHPWPLQYLLHVTDAYQCLHGDNDENLLFALVLWGTLLASQQRKCSKCNVVTFIFYVLDLFSVDQRRLMFLVFSTMFLNALLKSVNMPCDLYTGLWTWCGPFPFRILGQRQWYLRRCMIRIANVS